MLQVPSKLGLLPRLEVPLLPYAPLGAENLKKIFLHDEGMDLSLDFPRENNIPDCVSSLARLIDEMETLGPGVILTMGKGGVGKTTVAAAIAMELAQRGQAVHLTTTDPAAHVAVMVSEELSHLRVSRIDPEVET